MKVTSPVVFLIAGLFLGFVCDAESVATCGSGMRAAGCACNQVCGQRLRPCDEICTDSLDYCACFSGYRLPTQNAQYCVPISECPSKS